ncbi:hypothetical protein GCM10020358_30040 [Amorphoplanes nipponensis]
MVYGVEESMTVAFDRDNAQRSAVVLRDETAADHAAGGRPGVGRPAHIEVADLCAAECADIGTVLNHLTTAQGIFDGAAAPGRQPGRRLQTRSTSTITDRGGQGGAGAGGHGGSTGQGGTSLGKWLLAARVTFRAVFAKAAYLRQAQLCFSGAEEGRIGGQRAQNPPPARWARLAWERKSVPA